MARSSTNAWTPPLELPSGLGAEQRVAEMLADIQRHNGGANVYLSLCGTALEEARASDARHAAGAVLGPLDGVVVSVKDNIDVAGLATTAGLGFRRHAVARDDAVAVARLRAAGAVILGKTNMHAAAFGATNHNADFGDCANPAHPGRVAGGSSGGAAASIAAGWADLALGTDTMGSVRIPGSYCGVAAVKPSYGRISPRGSVPLCRQLDHIGLLGRHAASLRPALAVVGGFDPACADSRLWPDAPAARPMRALRAPTALHGLDIEPEVWDAFQSAIAQLEAAGMAVRRFEAQADGLTPLRRAGLLLCEAELLWTYREEWAEHPDQFPKDMAAALRWVEDRKPADFARAWAKAADAVLLWRAWLADADALLLPAVGQRAFGYKSAVPTQQADLTLLANFVGAPAAVLPIPAVDGQPMTGLQIMAAPGADFALLDFAERVEGVLNSGPAKA